ncbi:hypothetical protein B0O80DRAFT_140303 [Mortierella sp. GBAus27b]|nr:hypothetical protein B0O80DRAFT_140303 [Mortierella sp. GBAus27b]
MFSSAIHGRVDANWLRKSSFKDTNLTDEECRVMTNVINLIRPYVPKRVRDSKGQYQDPTPHVALQLPFAMIANQFLRAAGYLHFTRETSASVSMGSRHALPLNAGSVYEVLCSESPSKYDIKDKTGAPITSLVAARKHKDAVLESFFDMSKVHSTCHDHGITFTDRLIYVDRYTVRLQGEIIPALESNRRHPFVNHYDERKKRKRQGGNDEKSWGQERLECGKTKEELEELADKASLKVQSLDKEIRDLQKQLRTVADDGKSAPPDSVVNTSTTGHIKRKLCYSRQQVRHAKQEKYHWSRLEKTKMPDASWTASSPTITSKPSPKDPATLDDVEHTDISLLLAPGHSVAFAGVDPGLVTMEETVGISPSRFFTHINRYAPLANPDDAMDTDADTQSVDPSTSKGILENIKLPSSHRIKASTLANLCHAPAIAKRRERRLQKAPVVQQSAQVVADSKKEHLKDPSPQSLDRLQQIRRSSKPLQRGFENSKARRKDLHHLQEQTKVARSVAAAKTRQYVKNCK